MAAVAGAGLWWTGRSDGGPPPVAWRFATGSALASRPAVADGVLVIGASVTDTVFGIDTGTGKEKWRYTTGGSVDTSPADGEGLGVRYHDGYLYTFDLQSGEVLWPAKLSPQDERQHRRGGRPGGGGHRRRGAPGPSTGPTAAWPGRPAPATR